MSAPHSSFHCAVAFVPRSVRSIARLNLDRTNSHARCDACTISGYDTHAESAAAITAYHRTETIVNVMREFFLPVNFPVPIFADALSVVFTVRGGITMSKSPWMLGRLSAIITGVDEKLVAYHKISGKFNPVNSLTGKYVPKDEYDRDCGYLMNDPPRFRDRLSTDKTASTADNLDGVRAELRTLADDIIQGLVTGSAA